MCNHVYILYKIKDGERKIKTIYEGHVRIIKNKKHGDYYLGFYSK